MSETSNLNVLDFTDLSKKIEIPVNNLFGKNYLLREAGYAVTLQYSNSASRVIQIDSETGKPSAINAVGDDEAMLVAACLFEVTQNGGFIPVSHQTVKGWKHSVVKRLAEKCREISEINIADTVESLEKEKIELDKKIERLRVKEQTLKNESTATTESCDSAKS